MLGDGKTQTPGGNEMAVLDAADITPEQMHDACVVLLGHAMGLANPDLVKICVFGILPFLPLMIFEFINPAVVTKLADRGSIESIGVVTDVGLFLSLGAAALTARLIAKQGFEAIYMTGAGTSACA